jgi:hypothetical protein
LRRGDYDFLRVALLMNGLALLVGYSGTCIKTHSFVADVAEDWWKGAFGHDCASNLGLLNARLQCAGGDYRPRFD